MDLHAELFAQQRLHSNLTRVGNLNIVSSQTISAGSVQIFDSSGTWIKPTVGVMAFVEVWGAGGSGAPGTNTGGVAGAGGAGGAYVSRTIPLNLLNYAEIVTVGAGGLGVTSGTGNLGGNSSFGRWVTSYGGAGGIITGSGDYAIHPGSPLRAGEDGSVIFGTTALISTITSDNDRIERTFSGGWGLTNTTSTIRYATKNSLWGGGGGGTHIVGSSGQFNAPGTSSFGGNGGRCVPSSIGLPGQVPGGGGGAGGGSGLSSGDGASGRVKVTVW